MLPNLNCIEKGLKPFDAIKVKTLMQRSLLHSITFTSNIKAFVQQTSLTQSFKFQSFFYKIGGWGVSVWGWDAGVRVSAASLGAAEAPSGDKSHVGIAGVTLHKTLPISIIEDTNRCSFRLELRGLKTAMCASQPHFDIGGYLIQR